MSCIIDLTPALRVDGFAYLANEIGNAVTTTIFHKVVSTM